MEGFEFGVDVWTSNCSDLLEEIDIKPLISSLSFMHGTWMSRWKLGSMVSKWVITYTYQWDIGGYNLTHLLTIDPNFLGHPSTLP